MRSPDRAWARANRPAADGRVGGHPPHRHLLDHSRPLPVAQLPHVEVAVPSVDAADPVRPEEDVPAGLHQALTGDDALARDWRRCSRPRTSPVPMPGPPSPAGRAGRRHRDRASAGSRRGCRRFPHRRPCGPCAPSGTGRAGAGVRAAANGCSHGSGPASAGRASRRTRPATGPRPARPSAAARRCDVRRRPPSRAFRARGDCPASGPSPAPPPYARPEPGAESRASGRAGRPCRAGRTRPRGWSVSRSRAWPSGTRWPRRPSPGDAAAR